MTAGVRRVNPASTKLLYDTSERLAGQAADLAPEQITAATWVAIAINASNREEVAGHLARC